MGDASMPSQKLVPPIVPPIIGELSHFEHEIRRIVEIVRQKASKS